MSKHEVKDQDLLKKEAAQRDEHARDVRNVGRNPAGKRDEDKTAEELKAEEQERNKIKPPDSPHIVPTNNADPPPFVTPSPFHSAQPVLQPGVTAEQLEQAAEQQRTNNQQSNQDPPGSKNIPYEPGKPGQPPVGQQATQATEPDKRA